MLYILVHLIEWNVVQKRVGELVAIDSVVAFVTVVKLKELIMPKHFLNASSEFQIFF